MWAYFGITVFGVVGLATKPDSSYVYFKKLSADMCRIEEWALVQAKLRMEEESQLGL